jgi:4-amino-4-deoxy-L-arabinose transferase-like glycosyltransferase
MRALSRADNTPLIGLWLLVVLILLFAAWQAANLLSDDLIWSDEQYSLWVSGGAHYGPISPAEILERVLIDTGHPPLYNALLAAWGAFAGWSEVAGRAFSWYCGLLAIAWTYRLARDTVSPLAGVFAALAIGANGFFFRYMHEIRMYAPFALLTVICLWLYWRVVSGRGSSRTLIAFALSVSAALYTHYMAVLMLAILGLYHLVAYLWTPPERRGWWWQVFAGLSVGGLTFLPWALGPFRENSSAENMAWRGGADIGTTELLTVVPHLFANRGWPLLLLIGAFVVLDFLRPARRSFMGFLLFWTGGTLLLLTALNAYRPFVLSYRYVLMLWPAAAVLVGIGIHRMVQTPRYGRALAVLVMVAWVALIYIRADQNREPLWRGVQAALLTLEQQAEPQDAAVFYWSQSPRFNQNVLDFHTHDLAMTSTFIDFELGRDAESDVIDESRYQELAESFLHDFPFVWVMVGKNFGDTPYLDRFETALAHADFTLCGTVVDHPDMRLLLYRHEDAVGERGFACPA